MTGPPIDTLVRDYIWREDGWHGAPDIGCRGADNPPPEPGIHDGARTFWCSLGR